MDTHGFLAALPQASPLWFALLASGWMALIGLVVLWRKVRAERRLIAQQLQRIEQQLQMAITGAMGMGQRVLVLEQRLQQLQEHQSQDPGVDAHAYSQAIQMLEQGADAASVAVNCGLSSSEAQLMALIRKQLKPASGTAAATLF